MNQNYQIKLSNSGVTLAELLVVVAIIGIAAAIAAPFYRAISQNLNLTAAGRDLVSDLRYAQQLAVTTQVNHQLTFNTITNSYFIKNTATGAMLKSHKIKPPVVVLSITGLPGNTITFNATGAATSTGTIILTNPNNRQITIEIKPSGYVKIY